MLCSLARYFALMVPLPTQVYKWVLANQMLGVPCDELAFHPVASLSQGTQLLSQRLVWTLPYVCLSKVSNNSFCFVNLQTFRANTNRNAIVRHYLQPAIRASSIRVRPVSWRGHISMRVELYGRNAGIEAVV